jgi:hypothetical protein
MAKSKPTRANPALRLALIRQLHVYLSVFIAPSLLFFAGTGALQTFRIPDQKTAPALLVKLARVHKDDVFALKKAPPAKRPGAATGEKPAKPKDKPSTTRLKWFFSLASVAMIVTTLLGLWMAVAYNRNKAMIWLVLIAGAAAPVLILMF